VLQTICRVLAQATVRLFYPQRVIENGGALPARGPVIYVSNHVNALMDPLLIRVVVGRPAGFLAKSTLFGNPLGRLAMNAFGCVLIRRAHDPGGGGVKARAAANEAAFARCREALSRGGALALFPEGVSHSDPELRPLKKGAARIAVSAEREHRERRNEPLGLVIVPLGLSYRAKTLFRSQVRVVAGDSIPVAELLVGSDERAAEEALTARMRAALDQVVARAARHELREGQDGAAAAEPARPRSWLRAIGRLAGPVALAPFALIGAVVGHLPCRLAGYLARRMTSEEDMVATLKMLAGATFLSVSCLAAAVVVGWAAGAIWAPVAFVWSVASAYACLRFVEWMAPSLLRGAKGR
jgi:1-acyl-sn-glycerol-3-phosphate acyltransferase